MKEMDIKKDIEKILDNNKAENITIIDLKNKSYIADYMIIASGTSSRHLQSLSEILVTELKKIGLDNCRIEGRESNDWKLVDAHLAVDLMMFTKGGEAILQAIRNQKFDTWKKRPKVSKLKQVRLYFKAKAEWKRASRV